MTCNLSQLHKKSEYNHDAPHYEIFSTLLSLPPSPAQISLAPILKHHQPMFYSWCTRTITKMQNMINQAQRTAA
jgi:hypothetical protein